MDYSLVVYCPKCNQIGYWNVHRKEQIKTVKGFTCYACDTNLHKSTVLERSEAEDKLTHVSHISNLSSPDERDGT